MEYSKNKISSFLLVLLTIISSSALFAYGNATINQIIIITQFIILVLLALLNEIFSDSVVLIVLFLNAASLLITMAYHKSFGVSIIFFNLLLACFIFNNIQIEKSTFIKIHFWAAILWTLIAILSVKGRYFTDDWELHSYKLFNVTFHKNFMGMLALGCTFHWISLIEVMECRNITKKILAVPIIGIFGFKIIESDCRSAIIAIILFSVLYYIVKGKIQYKSFYLIIILGIIASGLFTIYYVRNVTDLDVEEFMGRTTFNRLDTWNAAFSLIKEHPVFGSGTDIKMINTDSAHNTVLSILKTIGIIPTISYVLCFAMKLRGQKKNNYTRICQIAIISALIITVFESFYVESFLYMPFLIMLLNVKEMEGATSENSNCENRVNI